MLDRVSFLNKDKNSGNASVKTLTDKDINELKGCLNAVIDYLNAMTVPPSQEGQSVDLSNYFNKDQILNLLS